MDTLFRWLSLAVILLLSLEVHAQVKTRQAGASISNNSRPFTEQKKAELRVKEKQLNDKAIAQIQDVFIETVAPYLNDNNRGHHFVKDYHLWTAADLQKLDTRVLGTLYDLAEIDDDDHLKQILPNYFRPRNGTNANSAGGVQDFKHSIEMAWNAGK